MQPSKDIARLIEIMASLRTPGTGCPWDLEQTHKTLAPYALEEAYEVADAIERGDMSDLRDELGDLLLQVVFHAQVAQEAEKFDFGDVVEGITAKMVRRHPHVFSSAAKGGTGKSGVDKIWEAMKQQRVGTAADEESSDHGLIAAMAAAEDKVAFSNQTWETIKAEERAAKGRQAQVGLLVSVPDALPGLTRAAKLQRKASTVGFDWGDARLVLAKIREEIDEIEDALTASLSDKDEIEGEIGDLLFAVVNLARHAEIDPEAAIRSTNRKFVRRFAYIEEKLGEQGSSPERSTLEAMDGLWDEAKAAGL